MQNRSALLWLFVLAGLLFTKAQTMQAQQPSDADPSAASTVAECGAPVLIFGAVMAPGRFELRRRVRLPELIALAGGTTEWAKGVINIIHTQPSAVCENSPTNDLDEAVEITKTYELADVLREDEKTRLYLRPGDIVIVPEFESVYVAGMVVKPGMVQFREALTVSQAVEIAGGLLPDAREDRIYVYRSEGAQMTPTVVNLKAITEHRAEDLLLHPRDVLEVFSRKGSAEPLPSIPVCVVTTGLELPLRIIN